MLDVAFFFLVSVLLLICAQFGYGGKERPFLWRQIENGGTAPVAEVLFVLPSNMASSLAFIGASAYEGKAKNKATPINLAVKLTESEAMAAEGAAMFSIALNKPLKPSESTLVDVYAVFTHLLNPFPAEITQADVQLVLYHDSAYVFSPYPVKVQTASFKLPLNPHVVSYTKVNPVKLADAELKYGPYENIPAFSSLPITVHYENNQPFAVVEELVREIELSNWGNIYVTEKYHLTHGGARHKGGFSRCVPVMLKVFMCTISYTLFLLSKAFSCLKA